jgi:hypothetical protein
MSVSGIMTASSRSASVPVCENGMICISRFARRRQEGVRVPEAFMKRVLTGGKRVFQTEPASSQSRVATPARVHVCVRRMIQVLGT